ncbi:uncharacterized protein G2W53_013965 [Senna tora]|uniref:Uncharacterized protein n=1 Tax=Senna tora TaxID=362788 RepID=A0A834U070_9FABA|nr:uncharacterized protein G2W53_013965 [Senna tora]
MLTLAVRQYRRSPSQLLVNLFVPVKKLAGMLVAVRAANGGRKEKCL